MRSLAVGRGRTYMISIDINSVGARQLVLKIGHVESRESHVACGL